jgi:type III pantothenate kinase
VAKLACELMMLVDIDIGNTRAKWRARLDGEIVDRGVIDTHGDDWSALAALRSHRPRRVRVSNVAGVAVAKQVSGIVEGDLGVKAEFALACESVGVVTSGYDNPQRLGVDRWLAILAGWELFRTHCVVVDAGSALTIDFVGSKGEHLGGYIMPGQTMMTHALFGGTCGVNVSPSQVSGLEFGLNTDTAVRNGCFAMALAVVEKAMTEGSTGPAPSNVVLTGGDAELLLPYLPKTVAHKPDLVLDGLVLALP